MISVTDIKIVGIKVIYFTRRLKSDTYNLIHSFLPLCIFFNWIRIISQIFFILI